MIHDNQYFQIKMYTSRGLMRLARCLTTRHCSSSVKTSQSQLFKQQRLEKMKHVKLYPHLTTFKPTCSLDTFRENYNYLESNSTSDDQVSLCGIVTSCRDYGKKLKFVDIERNGVSVQFKLARENFSSPEEFRQISDLLHRGDKIGKIL